MFESEYRKINLFQILNLDVNALLKYLRHLNNWKYIHL